MSSHGSPQAPAARKPLYAVKQGWKDFMAFPDHLKRGVGAARRAPHSSTRWHTDRGL